MKSWTNKHGIVDPNRFWVWWIQSLIKPAGGTKHLQQARYIGGRRALSSLRYPCSPYPAYLCPGVVHKCVLTKLSWRLPWDGRVTFWDAIELEILVVTSYQEAWVSSSGVDHLARHRRYLYLIRSPLLGACNSHNKPMQRHFDRPVYFAIFFRQVSQFQSTWARFGKDKAMRPHVNMSTSCRH